MQDLIWFLDIFGTAVFAMTGAVKGVKNRLDFLGVLFFAVTVGCGGGIIRDLLLGATPVAVFSEPAIFITCLASGIVVFIFSPWIMNHSHLVPYLDAVGLAVFTAIGVSKALSYGVGVFGQVMCGMSCAVGGGILRDIFSKEIPIVFTSDFYATASIMGALSGALFLHLGMNGNNPVFFFLTAGITFFLRLLGIKFHLSLPKARMEGVEK